MSSSTIRRFQDLDAWQVAMDLAVSAYALAARLPANERFELSSQVRRAAVSVPANVAEGQATGTAGLFVRHLRIALGSTGELETLFALAVRIGLLSRADMTTAEDQLARTGQLLHGLLRSLQRKRAAGALRGLALLLAGATIPLILMILR